MAKFEVIDWDDARLEKIYGTSLQGYIDVSYDTLVSVFGEPKGRGDSYKVDAEWLLIGDDGTVATVYNYKDGQNYLGAEGTPTREIRDWHVGGTGPESQQLVFDALATADSETDKDTRVHYDSHSEYTACGLGVGLSDLRMTDLLQYVTCNLCETAIRIAMSRSPR